MLQKTMTPLEEEFMKCYAFFSIFQDEDLQEEEIYYGEDEDNNNVYEVW